MHYIDFQVISGAAAIDAANLHYYRVAIDVRSVRSDTSNGFFCFTFLPFYQSYLSDLQRSSSQMQYIFSIFFPVSRKVLLLLCYY